MQVEEKIKNFITDENIWKRIITFALVLFFVLAILRIFGGLFGTNSPSEVPSDFEAQYIEQTENISVPGTFPVALINGPTTSLESGSYLTQKAGSNEIYQYRAMSYEDSDSTLEKARNVLNNNDFFVSDYDPIRGIVIGFKDNTRISFETINTSDGVLVLVSYEISGGLLNK